MIRAKRRADSQRALLAALKQKLGGTAELTALGRTPWASATFVGTRHRIALRLTGIDSDARATAIGDALPEMEFALPGHLVAEITPAGQRQGEDGTTLLLEALTIEED